MNTFLVSFVSFVNFVSFDGVYWLDDDLKVMKVSFYSEFVN